MILLTFIELLKVVLINMIILVMSAKLTSPGLLKIEIFQNNGYNIIIPDYEVIKKIYLATEIIL